MSKRILMMPSGVGWSHATRLRLIADQLVNCDFEIAVLCCAAHRDLFSAYRRFPTVDVVITDFASNVFAAYDIELVEQCVRDEMQAISVFQPDLIVADLRLTASISSRVANVPMVSIINAALGRTFDPVSALVSGSGWAARLIGRIVQTQQKQALVKIFCRVARQFRLRGLESLSDFLEGDLTLLADFPQFCPLTAMPNGYHYVGPIIWEGDSETVHLPTINPLRPLIYVTIGNTGSAELIHTVINVFRYEPTYQVIITSGAYAAQAPFELAPHIKLAQFIPGMHILPHAWAVVHCGGSGTTYQAIRHGIPALVVPYNNEQQINARLIQKHHLGRFLSPKQNLSVELLPALEKLADSDHTTAFTLFQALFQLPGETIAARHIERFLHNRHYLEQT
ncbi:MAG: glycosyltransferase [Candidatus Promineifilaceae bacterium]